MRYVIVIFLIFLSLQLLIAEIKMPMIHTSIMLDAKFYGGDANNNGVYDNTNRFQVRKAAMEVEGKLEKNIDYSFEFGVSTCVGAGTQLKLMDASIFYHLSNFTRIGVQQGHVMRSFAGITECSARMTMEKPVFYKTFATCHPTGLVIHHLQEIGEVTAIEVEAALMNGTNETLYGEHDYNFGTIFYTPLEGLAFTGVYNHVARNYFGQNYNTYSKDGYRSFLGVKYENYNISATGEYYLGKGFDTDDKEMEAWYAQAGYSINMNKINYIQPYIMYEFWDKDSNWDETEYKYVNFGINVGLSATTKLKFAYGQISDIPDGIEQPNSFVSRLQITF